MKSVEIPGILFNKIQVVWPWNVAHQKENTGYYSNYTLVPQLFKYFRVFINSIYRQVIIKTFFIITQVEVSRLIHELVVKNLQVLSSCLLAFNLTLKWYREPGVELLSKESGYGDRLQAVRLIIISHFLAYYLHFLLSFLLENLECMDF